MNDTTDLTTLTIRVAILVVIAGIFYFILKSDKKEEK
jgi:preprotein translocase subunit YajC